LPAQQQQTNYNQHIQHLPPSIEKPKNPLTPYFLFLKEKRETIKREYPELSPTEMANVMGQIWKSLTEEEKRPFELEYAKNRG
jgi:hypothetical protein